MESAKFCHVLLGLHVYLYVCAFVDGQRAMLDWVEMGELQW